MIDFTEIRKWRITHSEQSLKNLCFPDIEALYQSVFNLENVPYHLIGEDGAMEIPHNLMNLDNNLSIGTTREGNRLHTWINHCPLAPPIAANFVAPMDMAAFHSVGPDYVWVHAAKNTLHIASVEPLVKALQHFHLMQHSSLDSGVSVRDYDYRAWAGWRLRSSHPPCAGRERHRTVQVPVSLILWFDSLRPLAADRMRCFPVRRSRPQPNNSAAVSA